MTTPLSSKEVFFTLVSDLQRLGSGRLVLKPIENGQARGLIPQAALNEWVANVPVEPLTLIISTDSLARSVGSLPFALSSQNEVSVYPDISLLSGRRRAIHEAEVERRKRHVLLALYFSCAALLFMILYYAQLQNAQHQLERRLKKAGMNLNNEPPSNSGLLLFLLMLFFAFSLAVVWMIR